MQPIQRTSGPLDIVGADAESAAAPDTTSAPAPAPSSPVRASAASGSAMLSGRMAVAAMVTSAPPPSSAPPLSPLPLPQSQADVAARAAAIPRAPGSAVDRVFTNIAGFDPKRAHFNPKNDLDMMNSLDSGQFMALIDKFRNTPWKHGKSLLDKFVRRGVEARNDFIAEFAKIAADKLGYVLPANDRSNPDALRADAKQLLAYFGSGDKENLLSAVGYSIEHALDPIVNIPIANL